jgi:hypothetical protein
MSRTRLKNAFLGACDDNKNKPPDKFRVALPDPDFNDFCQGTPQGIKAAADFLEKILNCL